MLTDDSAVVLRRTFDAPVERVWRAITNVTQMRQWYFPQLEDFRAEKGFETTFNVHHQGIDWLHIWKIREVVPLKKISLDWKFGGYPGNSLLSFELFASGNTTTLVLTHAGLASFAPEKNPGLAKQNFVEGWTQFINSGLKEFLDRK